MVIKLINNLEQQEGEKEENVAEAHHIGSRKAKRVPTSSMFHTPYAQKIK